MKLTLAFSPCPNDCFMFDAIVNRRIDLEGLEFDVRLADVDEFLASTNGRTLFRDRYVALATSGSTGRRGIFLFSKSEWIDALALITRPMVWAGVSPNPFRPRRMAMVASTVPWHYSARVGQRCLPHDHVCAGCDR